MSSKLAGVKLASLLLLHRGELSVDEITALPFIEDADEASQIMSMLALHFDADIEQRRVTSSVLPTCEEVIRLRPKTKPVAIG